MIILNKKIHFPLKSQVEAGRMPFLISQEGCYLSKRIRLLLRCLRVICLLTGLFSQAIVKNPFIHYNFTFIFPAN